MPEDFFNTISPREQYTKPTASASMSRRDFLKRAGAAGLVAGLGGGFLQSLSSHDVPKQSTSSQDATIQNVELTPSPSAQKDAEEIIKENDELIGKTFVEQVRTQDRITLDATTKKAIYRYWREKFAPGTKEFTEVITGGLQRMKPWLKDMRQQFINEGVPDDLMYVSLAESHFKVNARSQHGAIGPFQITGSTANLPSFNLAITRNYDERRDPVASAALCAKHLRQSYERFGHDWDLALMDYNGGITNLYTEHIQRKEETVPIVPRTVHILKEGETLSHLAIKYHTSVTLLKRANDLHASSLQKNETEKEKIASLRPDTQLLIPQEREEISVGRFNAWLEEHVNTIITRLSEQTTYIVHAGDTMESIVKKFGLEDPSMLTTLNETTNYTLKEGDQLYIPPSLAQKRDYIVNTLRDFAQNINYPEKFYAIRDIIKEQFPEYTQKTHEKKAYNVIPVPKRNPMTFEHYVQRGDTLQSIAKKMSQRIAQMSPSTPHNPATLSRMLMLKNGHLLDEKHHPQLNKKLTLTLDVEKNPTLKDVAQKYNVTVASLHEVNPAVISAEDIIPHNALLRIPR